MTSAICNSHGAKTKPSDFMPDFFASPEEAANRQEQDKAVEFEAQMAEFTARHNAWLNSRQ